MMPAWVSDEILKGLKKMQLESTLEAQDMVFDKIPAHTPAPVKKTRKARTPKAPDQNGTAAGKIRVVLMLPKPIYSDIMVRADKMGVDASDLLEFELMGSYVVKKNEPAF